jgi:hypothetical protein
VFDSLAPECELAAEHGIVLTPHLTAPFSRWDGLVPTEDIVLAAGVYNLGFIGVGAGARHFLDWWAQCLSRECTIDVANCRFVDQRWIDLVPGYFGAQIVRDPGLNVAWWNLPTRTLARKGNGYSVNGSPLRFMHFSGYDPGAPAQLSKHQGPTPRVVLDQRPDLTELYRDYRDQLMEAGFAEVSRQTYGYGTLPSGAPIDREMREVYRAALIGWEREGSGTAEPPCPFVEGEESAFTAWVHVMLGRQLKQTQARRILRGIVGERGYAALGRHRRRVQGALGRRSRSRHARQGVHQVSRDGGPNRTQA